MSECLILEKYYWVKYLLSETLYRLGKNKIGTNMYLYQSYW